MASNRQIRISIMSALNAAGIEATKSQVEAMSRSVQKSMADAAKSNRTHWADIKAAWDMGIGAIKNACAGLSSFFKRAFTFETKTTQFKTLIGNIDEAKAHMADLKALGDTPPFSLDQFAAASRELMVMTNGALGYKKSLEMIGDAAAATGRPIEEVGHAVGRLFSAIRDGQPISRAVKELQNMGIVTPDVAQKLQDLQKAGKSNADIWEVVETQLNRYNGAMADTEKTGEGLIGAIKSRWDTIVRTFGEAFSDAAKNGLGILLKKMDELEKSGAIDEWADNAVERLKEVKGFAESTASILGKIAGGLWNVTKGTFGTAYAFAAGMDESGRRGDGWFNFSHGAKVAQEFWRREVLGEKNEDELREEGIDVSDRSKRIAEREAARKKREDEAKARIAAQLEEGRKNQEERAKAKEEAEAAKKAEKDRKKNEKVAEEAERVQREQADEDAEFEAKQGLIEAYDEAAEKEREQLRKIAPLYRDLNARIEKYKERLKEAEKGIQRSERGRAADARHTTGAFGPYQYGGRANGGDNFTDWQRGQRFADRADRDAEKAERRDAAAEKRYKRLLDEQDKGRKLSERDKKFMSDWEAYADQRDNAKNLRDALEIAQKKRDTLQAEIKKTIESIDKNVKAALALA